MYMQILLKRLNLFILNDIYKYIYSMACDVLMFNLILFYMIIGLWWDTDRTASWGGVSCVHVHLSIVLVGIVIILMTMFID